MASRSKSIRDELYRLVVFFAAALCIIGYIGYWGVNRLDKLVVMYDEGYVPAYSFLLNADRDFQQARVALMTALSTDDDTLLRSSKAVYDENIEQTRDRFESSASIEHVFFEEKVDLGRKFRTDFDEYKESLIRCGDFSCRIETVKWPEICCLQKTSFSRRLGVIWTLWKKAMITSSKC